jgi:two-component system chemotaxis response regulator CheY
MPEPPDFLKVGSLSSDSRDPGSFDHGPQEHAEPAEHPESTSAFSSTTILLVDDDPDIRALMRTFLEHIGFRVLSSGNANRAAQIFMGAQHVDLLIADQNMPGRSGMELAFQLKAIDPELPVLMISGGVIETASRSLFTQPGWTFLPKPFSLPVLLDTVHRILEPADGSPEPERAGTAGIQNGFGESNTSDKLKRVSDWGRPNHPGVATGRSM